MSGCSQRFASGWRTRWTTSGGINIRATALADGSKEFGEERINYVRIVHTDSQYQDMYVSD